MSGSHKDRRRHRRKVAGTARGLREHATRNQRRGVSITSIISEVTRLGKAAEHGDISEQEAAAELMRTVKLSPDGALDVIRNWRQAVETYRETARLVIEGLYREP